MGESSGAKHLFDTHGDACPEDIRLAHEELVEAYAVAQIDFSHHGDPSLPLVTKLYDGVMKLSQCALLPDAWEHREREEKLGEDGVADAEATASPDDTGLSAASAPPPIAAIKIDPGKACPSMPLMLGFSVKPTEMAPKPVFLFKSAESKSQEDAEPGKQADADAEPADAAAAEPGEEVDADADGDAGDADGDADADASGENDRVEQADEAIEGLENTVKKLRTLRRMLAECKVRNGLVKRRRAATGPAPPLKETVSSFGWLWATQGV